MATYTQDQLVDEALRKLMVVGSGQSPDSEDEELVNNKVAALIDWLSANGYCTISDPDAIPGEWFDAVASLLANQCAPDFGKPFSPDARTFYTAELLRTNMSGPSYESLKADHF